MTPQRFARRVRADLRARRWLRWHCSLIGLLTLLAYKAGAEGWLAAAWRRTLWPALATLTCLVALGAAIDHWLPQAQSLPHAVRLLRG